MDFAQKNIRLSILWLMAIFVALGACKVSEEEISGGGSEIKTLDNFARKSGVSLRVNHCGLEEDEAPVDGVPLVIKEENIIWPSEDHGWTLDQLEQLKKEVYKVLAQIPPSVLALFFALEGKVDFSRNAQHPEPLWKVCRETVETDSSQFLESDLLLSCWERDAKTGGATIYIDPASNGTSGFMGVHHALVRSFGYVLGQVFFKYDISPIDNPSGVTVEEGHLYYDVTEKSEPSENSKKMLSNLTNALWKDVYGKSRAEGSDQSEIKSTAKYDLSQYKDLYYSDDERTQLQFQLYAFAESFDSYHCSTKTRKLMKKEFKKTYCEMKYLDRNLRETFDEMLEGNDKEELKKLIDSYNQRFESDTAECEWENGTSFALGQPLPAKTSPVIPISGKNPNQSPNQIPTYPGGGYKTGGHYGGGFQMGGSGGYGCQVGCAIGGFFRSIFSGIGRVVGAVVRGVGFVIKGAFQIITYPFRVLFGAMHCIFTPFSSGGGPIMGGGIYGRPAPFPGKGIPNYPAPCYSNQQGYVAQSPYQRQFNKTYQAPFQSPNQTNIKGGIKTNGTVNQVPYQNPNQNCAPGNKYEQPTYEEPWRSNSVTSNNNQYNWDAQNPTPVTAKKKKKKKKCGIIAGESAQATNLLLLIAFLMPLFLVFKNSVRLPEKKG